MKRSQGLVAALPGHLAKQRQVLTRHDSVAGEPEDTGPPVSGEAVEDRPGGGEGLCTVVGLLGHADIKTTFGYAHIAEVSCSRPRTGCRAVPPPCSTAGRRTMPECARPTDALALVALLREREYAIHDTTLHGFTLRVQPNGARSWVFRFRRDGTQCRITLGKPEEVKAGQACAAALGFLAREKGGGNCNHDILRNMFDCAIAKLKNRKASQRCGGGC